MSTEFVNPQPLSLIQTLTIHRALVGLPAVTHQDTHLDEHQNQWTQLTHSLLTVPIPTSLLYHTHILNPSQMRPALQNR